MSEPRYIDANLLERELLKKAGDNPPMFYYYSEAIAVIRKQPTAYDIDKVVEELDEAYNNNTLGDYHAIVRKGGV